MAERGRLSRIGRRIAGRRGDPASDEPVEEPLPGMPDVPDPEPPEPPASGYERPSLAGLDLRESRRERIRRRLGGVSGRSRSDADAPTLFDQEPGDAGSPGATSGPDSSPDSDRDRATGSRSSKPLAGAGAAIASAGRATGAAVRDGSERVSGHWQRLEVTTRRRIAAVAIFVGAVAVLVLVIAPLAPCWVPGGDRCPPADDAIELVGADADAYVHMNLDPDTDQTEAAGAVTSKLPELTTQASGLLALATDRVIDYRRDIAPWSGGEIALVVDAGITSVDRVLLIEVADTDGAEAFVDSYLRDGVTESEVEGITVKTDRSGTAAAIAGGFLIIGPEDGVGSTVQRARGSGEGGGLAGDGAYDRVEESLPDDRVLDAWIAPALADTLFSGPDAEFRTFNTFVNAAATEGVGAALSFDDDTLGVTIRSAQDPEAPATDRDFFANLPDFEPTLADGIGADALAYLGIGNPAESAEALVKRAADTAPDLFSGLEDFNRRLGKQDGVDLQGDLLPTLDGETALTVEPQLKPGEGPKPSEVPGALAPAVTPYLAMLATGVDVDTALTELAELQGPIAGGIDPNSSGQAPVFESSEIAGVDAQSLQVSPVVDFTYAGWGDELVVGTSPLAVERARSDADTLADLGAYRQTTEPLPDQLSMLVYLNTRSVLALGEQLFLGADPAYARLAPDLRTLEAIALGVNSSKSVLATDLRVAVGEPEVADTEPAPIDVGPG